LPCANLRNRAISIDTPPRSRRPSYSVFERRRYPCRFAVENFVSAAQRLGLGDWLRLVQVSVDGTVC
jgi:hypothetical protein